MTNRLTNYYVNTENPKSQDSDLWNEVSKIFAGFEKTAFAQELKAVFDNLQDAELIAILQETRRTGRPGYPIRVMWHTLIAAYCLNIPSLQELRRKLHENPFLAELCGICSEKEVPSRFAYYRFISKLIIHEQTVENCLKKCADLLRSKLPNYGKVVAVDSTVIHTHSNPNKNPISDKDASWTVKDGKLRKRWHFGYKMQAVVCARTELPISIKVSTARDSDMKALVPALDDARSKLEWFSPEEVLADAGYDTLENYRYIVEELKAMPIIKVRNPRSHRLANRVKFVDGTPHCQANLPLAYRSRDAIKGLQYQCPARSGHCVCPLSTKCPIKMVWLKPEQAYRLSSQIPRDSEAWAEKYSKRVSVERVFSRLKEHRRLDAHYIRGLDKVQIHCLLSVLSMQAKAVSSATIDHPEHVRICTRAIS